jgi:hypothetical protein
MFARAIIFRRGGFAPGECVVKDPGVRKKSKRSTMQDLYDGKCPDFNKAAEDLTKKPSSIASAVRSSSSLFWTLFSGLAAFFIFM